MCSIITRRMHRRLSTAKPTGTRWVALVDMDAFLASVEQAINPALAGKPVVVGGLPRQRGMVICASYEARALGVTFGMSLAFAQRLAPHAIFVRGDIKIYRDWWHRICGLLQEFSPVVEPVSMDEAYVDLGPMGTNSAGPLSLAQQIRSAVAHEFGLGCSVGCAPSRIAAKIACRMAKKNRLAGAEPIIVLGPEQATATLWQLPIAQLPGVGEKTVQVLAQMGVNTVGQLQQVPSWALASLVGERGVAWQQALAGADTRLSAKRRLQQSISRETTFPADTTDRQVICAALYYLLERLCQQMRQQYLQARRIGVKLRYADGQTIEAMERLVRQSSSEHDIFPILEMLLDRVHCRRVAVRRLGVFSTSLVAAAWQQQLFPAMSISQRLVGALDEVRGHFGYHALQFGRTFSLGGRLRRVIDGYELRTPSLSL